MDQLKIDLEGIGAVDSLLLNISKSVVKVQVRAMNKTMTGIKTDTARIVAKDINLTQKRIKKDLRVRKANYSRPVANIVAIGRPVGLASFKGTRQTAKGLSVKVKRKRSIIRHAFLAEAKGGRQAFWRKYKGPRKPMRKGFPYGALPRKYRIGQGLKRLAGPRVPDIVSDNIDKIRRLAGDRMAKNMDHEMTRELKRL